MIGNKARYTRIACALFKAAIASVLLIFLASCASTLSTRKKDESLLDKLTAAADDYNRLLKWQDYDKAGHMVDPEMREGFLLSLDRYEGRIQAEEIQVLNCELLPKDKDGPKDAKGNLIRKGRVTIKLINMTVIPSNLVLNKHFVEDWVYKDESWYVRADLEEMIK